MKEVLPPQLARETIDDWSVSEAGLTTRVVHCLQQDGITTIRQLRDQRDGHLLSLPNFGPISLENVHWFFRWTQRLQSGDGDIPNFHALMREFLDPQQVFVIEHRYGLTDPLFRPHMKRCTLREIGEQRKVTRERMRQVEESALAALRSRLVRTVADHQEIYWINRIALQGGLVTFTELSEWVGDSRLGGYQPWGILFLLSEALDRITCRHDYFTFVPNGCWTRSKSGSSSSCRARKSLWLWRRSWPKFRTYSVPSRHRRNSCWRCCSTIIHRSMARSTGIISSPSASYRRY